MIVARIAVLVLMALPIAAMAAAEDSPWRDSLDAALVAAEGKPLALLFSADGCHWCHRLIEDSSANAEVRQALTQVVGVVVRAEDQPHLVNRLGITGFPTLVLVNRKRELVRTVSGYVPADELATTLRILALHGDADGTQVLDLGRGPDIDAILASADPVAGLIAVLGVGEPAQRARVREELGRRTDARDALWTALDSSALGVRVDASAALAQQLGAPAQYDPFAPADERGLAAARWRRDGAARASDQEIP